MTATQLQNKRLDLIGTISLINDEQVLDKISSMVDNLPGECFDRIPGLAYTHEERVAAILEAEEDIRAGRVYTHEEMVEWLDGLA